MYPKYELCLFASNIHKMMARQIQTISKHYTGFSKLLFSESYFDKIIMAESYSIILHQYY